MKKIFLIAIIFFLAVVSGWAFTIGGRSGVRSGSGPCVGCEVGMSMPESSSFEFEVYNVTDNGGEAYVVTDNGGEDYNVR